MARDRMTEGRWVAHSAQTRHRKSVTIKDFCRCCLGQLACSGRKTPILHSRQSSPCVHPPCTLSSIEPIMVVPAQVNTKLTLKLMGNRLWDCTDSSPKTLLLIPSCGNWACFHVLHITLKGENNLCRALLIHSETRKFSGPPFRGACSVNEKVFTA